MNYRNKREQRKTADTECEKEKEGARLGIRGKENICLHSRKRQKG